MLNYPNPSASPHHRPNSRGFRDLPSELIHLVFHYLDPISLLRLRTCKRLSSLAEWYLAREYHLPFDRLFEHPCVPPAQPANSEEDSGTHFFLGPVLHCSSPVDFPRTAFELQVRLALIDLDVVEVATMPISASTPPPPWASYVPDIHDYHPLQHEAQERILKLAERLLSKAYSAQAHHHRDSEAMVTVGQLSLPQPLSTDYVRILALAILDSVLLGFLYPETAVILIQQLDLELDRAQMRTISRAQQQLPAEEGVVGWLQEGVFSMSLSSSPPPLPPPLQRPHSSGTEQLYPWRESNASTPSTIAMAISSSLSGIDIDGNSTPLGPSTRIHQLCYRYLVPIVSQLLQPCAATPTDTAGATSTSSTASPSPTLAHLDHLRLTSSPRRLTQTLCFLPLLGRHFHLLSTETFLSTFLSGKRDNPTTTTTTTTTPPATAAVQGIRLDRATILVCSFMCVLDLAHGIGEAFQILNWTRKETNGGGGRGGAGGIFQIYEIFRIVERYRRLGGSSTPPIQTPLII